MLTTTTIENAGDLNGVIHDLSVAGTTIVAHTHPTETEHITIVARGKIKASGEGFEFILAAGEMVSLPEGKAHEILAMEDNTRIFNIAKRYKPD